jgi:hypothetical protein
MFRGERKKIEIFSEIGTDQNWGFCDCSFELFEGLSGLRILFNFYVLFKHVCNVSEEFGQIGNESS